MCGITGIFQLNRYPTINIDLPLLQKMAYPLRYRGPDQEGFFVENTEKYSIGLAHKRLSIIDLSENARQPMQTQNGDLILVLNGEIYNYKEIKQKLKGTQFFSTSDTEVVLCAYKEWGIEKTLQELDGMFAFAIFDKKEQKLILARDRFGEKPLYYFYNEGTLAFSSDIRSFNALPLNKAIDEYALGNYLAELCTPIENSIWKEIKKLPPACYLTCTSKDFKIESYWNLQYKKLHKINSGLAINTCENLIEKSIAQKLVADVPVGCFLSGGIDSSLVALFASKHYTGRLKTFSVGFEYEKFNELPYAKQVAEKIGSEHYEIIIDPKSLNIVDSLLEEYGEPFADSSQIPTYYVSQFAHDHVKVVLGGDGGDEIFGGYRTYNQGYRMEQWYKLRKLKFFLSLLPDKEKATYLRGIMNKDIATLSSALYRNMGFDQKGILELTDNITISQAAVKANMITMQEAVLNTGSVFDALLHAGIKSRLPNDYLVKTDRASMFNSLELRTPFLDKSLIEYTSTLPYNLIMKGGINKYITKRIAEKYFSQAFVNRPKMGFGIPIGEWMKNEWADSFKEILFAGNRYLQFDQNYLEKLYRDHCENRVDNTNRLWIVYVFNKWGSNNLNHK
jgi:asparagine synthase (glutamine-hydrolysing)